VARKKTAQMVNYVISACEKFTVATSRVWIVPLEKFLSIGMPRNDILFNVPDLVIRKVKDHFNLKNNKKIVLYAPTFRGDYRKADTMTFSINISYLQKALKSKFGYDFLVLYRSHIYDKTKYDTENENVILASEYPDIQELLCAADVLITDYSSSMWDFSLTLKPCFIFAPDLTHYEQAMGFYTPIEDWPFPFAKTNEQLIRNIIKFDNMRYIELVKKHHHDLGSYETGTAAKQFCERVFS
jgi:CDP-glycerol glycerophosphotransferase